MKINRRLIAKMIKRLEETPESYEQGTYGTSVDSEDDVDDRPLPVCGTLACLAGQAIICSERNPKRGTDKLMLVLKNPRSSPSDEAARLLGFDYNAQRRIFHTGLGVTWPAPYNEHFLQAQPTKAKPGQR